MLLLYGRILKRRKPKLDRILHLSPLCLDDAEVSLRIDQIGIDGQRLLIELARTLRGSTLLFNVTQRR